MRWALILAMLFLPGCAAVKEGNSGTFTHRPLIEQILRMRPGHAGLTHQICAEKNWFGDCKRMDLIEYNLNDKAVRDRLIKMNFRCKIAGWRYKIHPNRAAFVRYQRIDGGWFGEDETKLVNVVDQSELQVLLDGATVCWSEVTYPSGLH